MGWSLSVGATSEGSAESGGAVFGRAFFCETGVKKESRARFFDMLCTEDQGVWFVDI